MSLDRLTCSTLAQHLMHRRHSFSPKHKHLARSCNGTNLALYIGNPNTRGTMRFQVVRSVTREVLKTFKSRADAQRYANTAAMLTGAAYTVHPIGRAGQSLLPR